MEKVERLSGYDADNEEDEKEGSETLATKFDGSMDEQASEYSQEETQQPNREIVALKNQLSTSKDRKSIEHVEDPETKDMQSKRTSSPPKQMNLRSIRRATGLSITSIALKAVPASQKRPWSRAGDTDTRDGSSEAEISKRYLISNTSKSRAPN